MSLIVRLSALLMLALFTACSSTTTIPHSVGKQNAWFLENDDDNHFPIYCMANEKEKTAEPVCFKAKKVGF